MLKLELHHAGYCLAHEKSVNPRGGNGMLSFKATYALIEHPREGLILFDTGYTRRFYALTKTFPSKIYALATKVFISEAEEVVHVLQQRRIAPEEIKHIIISHFHADHVGGLKDFPNAQLYCAKEAYEQLCQKSGFAAVAKGILKGLIPEDIDSRVQLIDFNQQDKLETHSILGEIYDLWGDGSMRLVQLPGHAAGQIGALCQTPGNPTFLIADAAWQIAQVTHNLLPSPIVRLFFDDWQAYKVSLEKLHSYHQQHPEVRIIPCHCEQTYQAILHEV